MERLQKYLSRAGVASRRHAETLIVDGRVKVNGQVVTQLGSRVDAAKDLVLLDGKLVTVNPERKYFLFYKPPGVVTTLSDPEGRPTVADYSAEAGGRVFPVGRLDYDAEGALLLTDDGELANKLMHPSHQVPRVYLAKVKGVPDEGSLAKLVQGVRLEDGMANAVEARVFDKAERNTWVKIVVTEGRQHLVKRLCAAIGHPVVRLYRPAHASISVKGLKPGELRALTNDEIRRVKAAGDGDQQPEPSLSLPARRHGHAAPGFEPEDEGDDAPPPPPPPARDGAATSAPTPAPPPRPDGPRAGRSARGPFKAFARSGERRDDAPAERVGAGRLGERQRPGGGRAGAPQRPGGAGRFGARRDDERSDRSGDRPRAAGPGRFRGRDEAGGRPPRGAGPGGYKQSSGRAGRAGEGRDRLGGREFSREEGGAERAGVGRFERGGAGGKRFGARREAFGGDRPERGGEGGGKRFGARREAFGGDRPERGGEGGGKRFGARREAFSGDRSGQRGEGGGKRFGARRESPGGDRGGEGGGKRFGERRPGGGARSEGGKRFGGDGRGPRSSGRPGQGPRRGGGGGRFGGGGGRGPGSRGGHGGRR